MHPELRCVEAPIGPYSLAILAQDSNSNRPVIIKNQLPTTISAICSLPPPTAMPMRWSGWPRASDTAAMSIWVSSRPAHIERTFGHHHADHLADMLLLPLNLLFNIRFWFILAPAQVKILRIDPSTRVNPHIECIGGLSAHKVIWKQQADSFRSVRPKSHPYATYSPAFLSWLASSLPLRT